MRLSRRLFILSGLMSVPGLYYWKTQKIISDDIQSFFFNYESVIPIESTHNISDQTSFFEEELLKLLSISGVVKTIAFVNKNIKDEYQLGKVKLMNGWIVSETEFKVLSLRKDYV